MIGVCDSSVIVTAFASKRHVDTLYYTTYFVNGISYQGEKNNHRTHGIAKLKSR